MQRKDLNRLFLADISTDAGILGANIATRSTIDGKRAGSALAISGAGNVEEDNQNQNIVVPAKLSGVGHGNFSLLMLAGDVQIFIPSERVAKSRTT